MAKPYALFYHVWCPENLLVTRMMVDEQLKRIARAGLPEAADIFCCINGVNHAAIRDFISGYEWVTIKVSTEDQTTFEGLTLERLYDHCIGSLDLEGVGYIHTKGLRELTTNCTDHRFRCLNSWRHFLEWGTLDRWRDAVALLETYDAVGVNLRDRPWRHFSGNAWWANPSYIRTLIRPVIGAFPPGDYGFITATGAMRQRMTDRLDFERWLGLNEPRCHSFYGFPFMVDGQALPHDFHNLYENDIEPYYRRYSS